MRTDGRLSVGAPLVLALGLAAWSASTQEPVAGPPAAAAPGTTAASAPATTISAAPATTTTTAPPQVSFSFGSVDVQAIDADPELPDEVRTGVHALLARYLDRAVVLPLRSGQPAGDLSSVFAEAALDRMNGPDRAALVDEGLPPTAQLKVTAAEADLTALIGPDGVAIMTAGIKLVVTGAIEGAPLTVERTGELLLTGEGGDWRVTGYTVRVSRDSVGSVTATTVQR